MSAHVISTKFQVPVSSNSAYQNCIDSGRTEQDCQNYYKVLVKITDNDLMLCGTSSFQPMCDIRHVSVVFVLFSYQYSPVSKNHKL